MSPPPPIVTTLKIALLIGEPDPASSVRMSPTVYPVPATLIAALISDGLPVNSVFCINSPSKSKANTSVMRALIAATAASSSSVISAEVMVGKSVSATV